MPTLPAAGPRGPPSWPALPYRPPLVVPICSARPLILIPAHGYVPLIIYLEGSDAGGGAAFVEARTAEAARRRRRGSAARTTSKREQRRRRRRRGRAHPARTAPRPLSTRRAQIFLILSRPPLQRVAHLPAAAAPARRLSSSCRRAFFRSAAANRLASLCAIFRRVLA